MPATTASGIEIYFETFGDVSDPTVLLINGFTSQLLSYPEDFCEQLASRGFHVIRFDNRDVGLSHKTPGPAPAVGGKPAYRLSDMARDAIGILDALDIERAHIVGVSMGGMIAQRVAIEHPQRVLTLTSIMSTTGNTSVGGSTPEAIQALMTPPPREREAYIEHSVRTTKAIQGPLWTEELARERAAAAYDRCFHPVGAAFQLAAIMVDGDRTELLGKLTCPTLVIHGRVDPLVGLSAGEATAAAVPGAELIVLDEMGHDLPQKLWPEITGAIAKHASSVPIASANAEA